MKSLWSPAANLHQTTSAAMREVSAMSRRVLLRSPRCLQNGMGDREPDEPVICRICGRPILKGEPRYREPEGDVHLECRRRTHGRYPEHVAL